MSLDASNLLVLPAGHKDRIDLWLERLKGEVKHVLDQETSLQDTVVTLRNELGVYKRAYLGIETEREQLCKAKEDAEKQRDELQLQMKGNRVVALLDGDGAIFSSDLISQGQAGGHIAAQKLADSIIQYMNMHHGVNQYQLWVYVFLNKRGLSEAFGRYGLFTQKVKFDDFLQGFNQAAERFMMVDVGTTKEAADSKIKAYLEDEIRLPQTCKVLFGGCHDNGYVSTLRSQITAGFKHKIALIQSYTDMAAGIAELDLPSLRCPDLFLSQKLGSHTNAASPPVPPPAPPMSSSPSPQQTLILPSTPNVRPVEELSGALERLEASPSPAPATLAFKKLERRDSCALAGFEHLEANVIDPPPTGPEPSQTVIGSPVSVHMEIASVSTPTPEPEPVKRPAIHPPSYSSAVLSPRRPPTPELDSCGSSAASDVSDDHPSPRLSSARHVNPNVPLSKHKPPPCTLFYLANCKYGSECKYAHNYILEAEHFEEIKTNAKKAPCPSVNKGEPCIWGDACCYGHVCPGLNKCVYNKQGRCKFTGVDMHKPSTTN
ncbi:hypothetical protein ONZ45_g17556 [Pleurotus djamor]|nr:hypothetical protein ONZ45_g17556 [Pleurotus djamor]